ncbi:DUF3313 domain-containing protein [Pseudomonas sp. NPDC090755]|uniref:DUF3313 domain-containing protein n=1 Tax=Pseudomonas sp. NPDC090755 TaxID=3364481 RepID=UPI00383A7F86
MNFKAGALLVCASMLFQGGCTSKVVNPEQYSGFLSDYNGLAETKSPSGAVVMRWIQPGVDASKYKRLYIEPSQFYPKPQASATVPQMTLDGIAGYYDQALNREFSKTLPIVMTPSAGTLIVRPAITAVSAKTQGLHVYEVIPIALVAAGISAATGIRDQDTNIATEAEFVDATDGRVVAKVVRKGAGKTLANSSQVMKAADVKAVLDGWASDMHLSFEKIKDN